MALPALLLSSSLRLRHQHDHCYWWGTQQQQHQQQHRATTTTSTMSFRNMINTTRQWKSSRSIVINSIAGVSSCIASSTSKKLQDAYHLYQKQQQQLDYRARTYYTNGHNVKRTDPYAVLGLQYGDGSTWKDIQNAYRDMAAKYHPDVNRMDTSAVAIQKFQQIQQAYEQLKKLYTDPSLPGGEISIEQQQQWSRTVYVKGDRIALHRTDVAGLKRQRPIPSISSLSSTSASLHHGGAYLGHPNGYGIVNSNSSTLNRPGGEYLTSGSNESDSDNNGMMKRSPAVSSSVGRGQSKWVQPKPFQPWDGSSNNNHPKR